MEDTAWEEITEKRVGTGENEWEVLEDMFRLLTAWEVVG